MSTTTLVYIVDDDPDMTTLLSRIIASMGLDSQAFNDPTRFLAQFDPARPGCVMLDHQMPFLSGSQTLERLNRHHPAPTVLLVTARNDVNVAVESLKSGAFDFVTKPFEVDVIREHVAAALKHDRKQRARSEKVEELRRGYLSLTPREREVMLGVLGGHMNKVIAGDLGVSVRTVEIHRSRLMKKMNAQSISALIHMAALLQDESPEIRQALEQALGEPPE